MLRGFEMVDDGLGTRVGVDASLPAKFDHLNARYLSLSKSERKGMDVLVVAHYKSKVAGFG